MPKCLKILLVEDNKGDAILINEYLCDDTICQYSINEVESLNQAISQLKANRFDIILLDLNLPDSNGIDTLIEVIKYRNNAGVILLTGMEDECLGMEAVNRGAQDYLVKNKVNPELLIRTINYAVARNKDQLKLKHLQKVLRATRGINQLVTKVESTYELINESCKIFVGSEGYHTAWIILSSKNEVIQKSQQGLSTAKFDEFFTNFKNNSFPNCLKRASQTSNYVVAQCNTPECDTCPLLENRQESTSFVKQLKYKNRLLGFMGVTIGNEYANNQDETNLFNEVTNDIAFSLSIINERIEKEKLTRNYLQEQKKLQTLVNNLPGIAFRCKFDLNWTMNYLSEGCTELLGYTQRELVNNKFLSFENLIHPDDKQRVRDEIEHMCQMRKRYAIEYRIITKDQKEKWVLELGSPDFNSELEITHIDGYITEITDKKHAVIRLEESEEAFRLLAENSVDCIWKMDKRLRFTYASPAHKDLLGYESEKLLGQSLSKFTKWKSFAKVARVALRTLLDTANYSHSILESTVIAKSGQEIPVEITIKALMDHNNRLIGLQGSTKDISERIYNNRALMESELQFRALYENSPDMLASISPKTGEVMLCNKTLLRSLGYNRDEIIGKPIAQFFHQSIINNAHQPINNHLNDNSLKSKEMLLKRKDGTPLHVSLNVETILGENNKVLYSIASWRDITEKKRTEDLLKKQNQEIRNQIIEYEALNKEYFALNESLRESNKDLHIVNKQLKKAKQLAEQNEKLKSAFMANMSHEIRTPMNAIIGFSNFLGQKDVDHNKKETFVKHINNAGKRLLQVINDIVDISKIEANQLSIAKEEFSIYSAIKESYELFQHSDLLSGKPNLQLIPRIDYQYKNLHIETDITRFRQILDNLITNAIKYTTQGIVEFGFHPKTSKDNSWIEVYVKDSGIGIPDDKKDIIFKRFRQVEEMEFHEGSGLGLSIAKGLVNLLGGNIWFESEHGKGSTFYFTVPYKQLYKPNTPPKLDTVGTNNFKGVKILIAEDDVCSYDYLSEIFSDIDAEICFTKNGQELMNTIEHFRPNLLLLDINMPIKNGFECLREIKTRNLNHTCKIIAQTAYAFKNEKEQCLKEGCNEYIAKPYTKEELLEKVTRVMNLTIQV